MGSTARALGMGARFDYQGASYELSPWTYGLQAEMELYLEGEALRTCKKMREHLTEKEYADLVARTRQDIESGQFSFGSEHARDCILSGKHMKYMAWLMLKSKNQGLAWALVEEMCREVPDVILEKMAEANADPNPLPPAPPGAKA